MRILTRRRPAACAGAALTGAYAVPCLVAAVAPSPLPTGASAAIVLVPAAAFLALFFVQRAWGLAFFIALRSLADAAGEVRLGGGGGFSVNAGGLLGVAVLVAGVVSLRRLQRDRRRFLLPFLPLLGAAAVAGIVGIARFGGSHLPQVVREGARLAAIPAFFTAVLTITSQRDRRLLRRVLYGAIVLCGVWGGVQFAVGAGVMEATSGVRRATGPFAYPNTLGYVLLLGINLLVAQVLAVRSGRAVPMSRLAFLAALLVMLAFTASFTIFALLVLSAVLFLFLERRVVVLGVLVVLVFFSGPLLLPRVRMLLQSNIAVDVEEGLPRNTLTARPVIWRGLLEKFREKPGVGWGLRSVPLVNPVREIDRGVGSDPHNDLILFLVEGGLIGLAGFCAYQIATLLLLARLACSLRGTAAEATALWVTWVAMMAGSLANNLLSFTAFLFIVWGWVGVVLSDKACRTQPPALSRTPRARKHAWPFHGPPGPDAAADGAR